MADSEKNHISRRNLFRRSLGIPMPKDKSAPEKAFIESTPENNFPIPAAAENVTPEKILKRIDAEPSYRHILQRLLAFCSEPKSVREIHDEIMCYTGTARAARDPKMLLAWMIEVGAIAGHAAEGSETTLWRTTEAGIEAVAGRDPAERLRRLLEEEPAYADIYRMILKFCYEERSLSDIEYLLQAHLGLRNPPVYPSYLIDRLEFTGALEWTGKWRTTEAGKGKE